MLKLNADLLRSRLVPLFERNFSEFGELGAAVSIWQNGAPVLDLCGGFRDARCEQPWTAGTIVLVWSATKGIGSACLLHALQENGVDIDERVARFWPEFAQNDKGEITIAQLMSHQAGLAAFDAHVLITDHAAVIHSLEKQKPLWLPGAAHGYHARTLGFLTDELVRRLSGISISEYWQLTFAKPLALDFWIGLPDELNERCATMYAAKVGAPPEPAGFYRKLSQFGTLQQRTFTSPAGLHAVSAMNTPATRALDIVSFGGIGSAAALAKFYAMLANGGEIDGVRFFNAETIAWMTTKLASGIDNVFEIPTAFSAGFMKSPAGSARKLFGPSPSAFGHPGAGGSNAFADPGNAVAFAYVMNQMEQTLFPRAKSQRLVDIIYRADR